jgi:hypothetical protein
MYDDAKKLFLIKEILTITSDKILHEVESVITKSKLETTSNKSFKDFFGMWTAKEANEMKRIIEDNCEQINPDDWK